MFAKKKIYAYENSDGDKGIIIAKSYNDAKRIFHEKYPKRKIVEDDSIDYWGAYWKYGKLSGYRNTVAVISYIDSDCLLRIAEELRNINDNEI